MSILRYLRSNFAVASVVALSSLVAVTLFLQSNRLHAQQEQDIKITAMDMLGFIEYKQNRFLVSPQNAENFQNYLAAQHELSSFAYIYDLDSKHIVWNSLKSSEGAVINYLHVFNQLWVNSNPNIHSITETNDRISTATPELSATSIKIPALQNQLASEYVLATQFFTFKNETNPTKLMRYMFVTAKRV